MMQFQLIAILVTLAAAFGFINARFVRIPDSPETNLIVAITYVVVVFSILVQSLTITPLAYRFMHV